MKRSNSLWCLCCQSYKGRHLPIINWSGYLQWYQTGSLHNEASHCAFDHILREWKSHLIGRQKGCKRVNMILSAFSVSYIFQVFSFGRCRPFSIPLQPSAEIFKSSDLLLRSEDTNTWNRVQNLYVVFSCVCMKMGVILFRLKWSAVWKRFQCVQEALRGNVLGFIYCGRPLMSRANGFSWAPGPGFSKHCHMQPILYKSYKSPFTLWSVVFLWYQSSSGV